MDFITTAEWQKRQREAPLRSLATEIHAMTYSALRNNKEPARESYGYLPTMLRSRGYMHPTAPL